MLYKTIDVVKYLIFNTNVHIIATYGPHGVFSKVQRQGTIGDVAMLAEATTLCT
jgi:hypothetical protein